MSGPPDHPLAEELKKVQYDLTALKGRISEIQRQVAAANLPLPDLHECDRCHMTFRYATALAEHLYVSHDGPVPAHYVAIEARAVDPEALQGAIEERNAA